MRARSWLSGHADGGTRSPPLVRPVQVQALPGARTRARPAPCSNPYMAGQRGCPKNAGDWLPSSLVVFLTSGSFCCLLESATPEGQASSALPSDRQRAVPPIPQVRQPHCSLVSKQVGARAGPGTMGSPGLQRNSCSPHFYSWEHRKSFSSVVESWAFG